MNHLAMKTTQTTFLLSLFILLCCTVSITSCFNYSDKKYQALEDLTGKWQLQRIEDPYKIVMPPTSVINVELEFRNDRQEADSFALQALVKGNTLAGNFTGRATYSSDSKSGNLDVGPLSVTEDVLLTRYRQFDEFYLQQLARASDYCIVQDRLIIETKDGADLVYTWSGQN